MLAGQLSPLTCAAQYAAGIQFPVVDTRNEISDPLGRDLIVEIRRAVDAHGNHFGWDLAVVGRDRLAAPGGIEPPAGPAPRFSLNAAVDTSIGRA